MPNLPEGLKPEDNVTPAQEVVEIERELRRRKARRSPLFFAQHYLGHLLTHETPAFHKELYELFETKKRLGVAAPRNFAKTTILVIINSLWRLLTGEGEYILVISSSDTLAKDWVRRMKQEMESNEKILEDFGTKFRFGKEISQKWTENHLSLDDPWSHKPVNQVLSRGKGTQIRGFRPTRVLCDDLEDDLELRNEENRKHNKEWFLGPVLNTIRSSDQIIVIGTLLHPLCLLKEIIDKNPPFEAWETRKYAAIMDGESIWPARWPMDELRRKMDESGMWTFNKEFMNDPQFSDDILFKPEWIKRADAPECSRKIMGIDLAASQKRTADFTAYAVWGEKDKKYYLLEARRGHWGTLEQIEKFLDAAQRHGLTEGVTEEGLLKLSFGPILHQTALSRKIPFQIRGLKLGAYSETKQKVSPDKVTRAYRVLPLFERGDVFFNQDRDIVQEFSTFPTGQHDDWVDASVHALFWMSKGGSAKAFSTKKVPVGIKNFWPRGFDPRKNENPMVCQ